MMKFTILVRGTDRLAAEVEDDSGTLISSQTFLPEADADDWIIEQGQPQTVQMLRLAESGAYEPVLDSRNHSAGS